MTRLPPFAFDPTLVECPLCSALIKHSNLGRHAMSVHEIEIEQRLVNPDDAVIKEFADLDFKFTKKD